MEKPPLTLRKVDSQTSTNSSSSQDQYSVAKDDQSRRLVDYFVVFCTKPPIYKRKKKNENQDDEADNEEEEETEEKTEVPDDDKHGDGADNDKSNTKQKRGKRLKALKKTSLFSRRKKNSGSTTKGSSSPRVNKRLGTRAVHLTDAMEKAEKQQLQQQANGGGGDEDATPLLKNRKLFQENTDNVKAVVDLSSNGRTTDMQCSCTPYKSYRVPVTNGSFVYDSDNDEKIATEEFRKDEVITPSKMRKKINMDDDTLTPSRMRAMQGSPTKNKEDETNCVDERPQPLSPLSDSGDIEPNSTMDETQTQTSENIHVPGHGIDGNNDDTKLPEFHLVPVETARYPPTDHADCPLNPMISHFCFPQGHQIQFTTEYIMPRIHYFVLTNDKGKKVYGVCLTVYEEFIIEKDSGIDEKDLQMYLRNDDVVVESDDKDSDSIEVSIDFSDKFPTLYHPKVLCIISSWPYLHAFREYLSQLYRLATMTDMMKCPIERYVLNICEEIPAPPPGMFEIRLQILNSTIRFWAPPGKQPIQYVSIPFNALFECLDINNIIFVWYALTLEHKVLLVSSQNSLLTLCAEILCSLLFPMEWTHFYVPILPLFLTPMLDAPFPYLCGINRCNFLKAVGDISEETIVVDLDQNVITMGGNTSPFPPMPLKRRSKLEASLQKHAGDIFWTARGVTKQQVLDNEEASRYTNSNSMIKALHIWKEKLQSYDDAFCLAFTPDSENMLNEGKNLKGVEGELEQSQWDCVQEAFLRFYVAMLRDYARFIDKSKKNRSFKMKEFLSSQRPDFKPFLKEFCCTQQFDCFVTKRMYNPKEPDVKFFDESITAKKNRSKMTLKKKRTPFLLSAVAHKQLRRIDSSEPSDNSDSNFNLLDKFYATASPSGKKAFAYKTWPETFNMELFANPRNIPDAIAAEFDRRASLAQRANKRAVEFADFKVSELNVSDEVQTFTLFFVLFCDLVGKELEVIRNQYRGSQQRVSYPVLPMTAKDTTAKEEHGNDCSPFTDCSLNICSRGTSVSSATITSETTTSIQAFALETMKTQQLAGFAEKVKDTDVETAKVFADAELNLAFSALETLLMRKLRTNMDAVKALMTACGRCGNTQRASQLMSLINERGLISDGETYSKYLLAFAVSNEINPDEPIASPLTNVPIGNGFQNPKRNRFSKMKWRPNSKSSRKLNNTFSEASEDSSFSGTGSSFHDTVSITSSTVAHSQYLPPRSPTKKKKKLLRKKEEMVTTEQINRHLKIGESLLSYLYENLDIDTNSATCSQCSTILKEDQVRLGWKVSFNDYTTECPQCKHNFVPRFVVKTDDSNFVGSQGPGTPLHCEYLSPWVLHKEIHAATQGCEQMDKILDPEWRCLGDANSTLWWNLVVSFQRHKLPLTFLLQGNFRERLIMPMPDQ